MENTQLLLKMKITSSKIEADDKICQAFATLHELIDQCKKVLLTENSRIEMSKATRLSIQLEDIQRLSESVSQCCSLATSEYSDVQLLSIADTLHNRLVSLQQQFTITPLDLCETPDIMVDVNTDALADVIAEFGGVADLSPSNSTAIVPRQRLGIGAEMKVRVITRDGKGGEITKSGAMVRSTMIADGKECVESLAVDEGDGTYLVSVLPRQLGQHQLSITVNSRHVQGSLFNITVVPQRDYTKLLEPVQTITGIKWPHYIAFSNNGDMFVTSADYCIHVYDKSGNKKTTIGSEGSGELQFNRPRGIDINGDIVYVAELYGHRIHKLATGGEFISTFGEKGSAINQFDYPYGVKISPDNKVYVADDSGNHRVQVFHSNWTISHVIDGRVSGGDRFPYPEDVAFDLFGNVHVTGFSSSSVTVFTPDGQIIRWYNTTDISSPRGIAIDPSGYSLVVNWGNGTLSVFDARGVFIHSVGGLRHPYVIIVVLNCCCYCCHSRNLCTYQ